MSDDVTAAAVAQLNARVGIDFSAPEWHTISPALAALAMRERAASEMDISAHVMSHYGSDIEQRTYQSAAKQIRALPTTFTNAELLAAAMQLPEVRALMAAVQEHCIDNHDSDCKSIRYIRGACTCGVDDARAALAPFTKGAS